MRWVLAAVLVGLTWGAAADDLRRAQELAWAKEFAASEAIYRRIVAAQPGNGDARLGLARVVLWQGRYPEAIALFAQLTGVDALEGRATAEYWSGDYRAAARHFREVLVLDRRRDFAQKSLAEIRSTTTSSQELAVIGSSDDQPLDLVRAELRSTFFSDPLTRWTATLGRYQADAQRTASGTYVSIANQTKVNTLTFAASVGLFTSPDGEHQPIGTASVSRGSLTLGVERQPEIASAPSLDRHVASTATTLRWDHDRNWIATVELTDRRYSDRNRGWAAAAYALMPARRNGWTLWAGGSLAARDTDQSRFNAEGRYDPYWTPDDLCEGRVVLGLDRSLPRGAVKLHGDIGYARDRGRAFDFPFDRSYRPWRLGLSAEFRLTRDFRIETGIDRSSTVDYRVTSFHAGLVRRR